MTNRCTQCGHRLQPTLWPADVELLPAWRRVWAAIVKQPDLDSHELAERLCLTHHTVRKYVCYINRVVRPHGVQITSKPVGERMRGYRITPSQMTGERHAQLQLGNKPRNSD